MAKQTRSAANSPMYLLQSLCSGDIHLIRVVDVKRDNEERICLLFEYLDIRLFQDPILPPTTKSSCLIYQLCEADSFCRGLVKRDLNPHNLLMDSILACTEKYASENHNLLNPESPKFNGELLGEILQWLLIKDVLRFRSICKVWKEVIDSREFKRLFLDLYERLCLLLDDELIHVPFITFDPITRGLQENAIVYDEGPVDLIGTLHGIICLWDYTRFILWNPSLRRRHYILCPSEFANARGKEYLSGFWLDPLTAEYKILFARKPKVGDEPSVRVWLFSSTGEGWRALDPIDSQGCFTDGIKPPNNMVIENCGYWVSSSIEERAWIFSFDFLQETWHNFALGRSEIMENLLIVKWKNKITYVSAVQGLARMYSPNRQGSSIWSEVYKFEYSREYFLVAVFEDPEYEESAVYISKHNWDRFLYLHVEAYGDHTFPLKEGEAESTHNAMVAYDYIEESLIWPV